MHRIMDETARPINGVSPQKLSDGVSFALILSNLPPLSFREVRI
jgi:hypothetical protein